MKAARLLQALAVGAAVALVVLLFRQLGWLDLWEFRSRDLRTRWTLRPEGVVRDDVRLVMVTDESIELVHKNNDMTWPWDWDFHALLFKAFAEGKADCILFDFHLLERRDGHEKLLGALKAGPPAWFAGSFWQRGVANPDFDERLAKLAIPVETDGSVEIPETYQKAIPPSPEIAPGLTGVCDVATPRDGDGMMRRYKTLSKYKGRYYPTFGLAGLMAREKARTVSLRNGMLHVGKRSIPVAKDGTFMLRYYPAFVSFGWKPAWPVLGLGADKVEPGFFRDASVIVGTNASGLTDLRMTPVTEVMAGSEVHATALANLLNEEYLREASPALSVGLILMLSLGIALLTRHASAAVGGVGSASLLVAFAVASVLLYRSRWVVELVAPMGAGILAFASTSAVNFLYEGRQRLRTKREFQRYMSPKVVEKVLKNPDAMSMAGERKVISIFFMDFAGFTSMSEKLDAVEVCKLMNEYHNEAAEEIFRTEGTLDKFIGDAIMAFWNDPIEQADHALRACLTAVETQKRLVVMAQRMRERGLPEMTARIGINTGVATMGNMGAKVQFQYTAIGDEVNLASRLEGVNKEFGSKIIVAEPTWQAAKDRVEARVLALIKVKGKKLPVRIHELLGLKGEVGADVLDAARAFEAALEAMQKRRFAEAREAFRGLAEKGDRAAALYVDVCGTYLEQPPPPDWDGSYQMDHK